MDDSSSEIRNEEFRRQETLRVHSKTFAFIKGTFTDHQFSSWHISDPLTQLYRFVGSYNILPAGIVTDKFGKEVMLMC